MNSSSEAGCCPPLVEPVGTRSDENMLVTQDFVFLSNYDSIEVSRIAAEGAETLTPTLLIFSAALLRTTHDAALVFFNS